MLGLHRGVTEAGGKLQKPGVIDYSSRQISVLGRSWASYGTSPPRSQSDRAIGPVALETEDLANS
jgi:hypothetical protein